MEEQKKAAVDKIIEHHYQGNWEILAAESDHYKQADYKLYDNTRPDIVAKKRKFIQLVEVELEDPENTDTETRRKMKRLVDEHLEYSFTIAVVTSMDPFEVRFENDLMKDGKKVYFYDE